MALTNEEIEKFKASYLKDLDALVEAGLREKRKKGQRLTWNSSDTGSVFHKWSQMNKSSQNKVFFSEQGKWIYEQTNKVGQQKIQKIDPLTIPTFELEDDPNYFGPKGKKTDKLPSPRLSISQESPPQLANSKVASYTSTPLPPPPAKHPFDKELTKLGTYINKLEALKLKGELSGGKNFLGIQFKSNQEEKLKEAKSMYALLKSTNTQSRGALNKLHQQFETAIIINKEHTGGPLLHGTGRLEEIYKDILSKTEVYTTELKEGSAKGKTHPHK